MRITEVLESSKQDIQRQGSDLDRLREDRTRWRFFWGEVTAGTIIGLGEVSLGILRSRVSNDFRRSPQWGMIKVGWRVMETLIGVGVAILKDKSLSYVIEDAESQLDWDSRHVNRVERLMDDAFLSIYRDYPLAPGG